MLAASWVTVMYFFRDATRWTNYFATLCESERHVGSHIDLVGGTNPAPIVANTTVGSMPVEELALHEVTCRRVMQQLWQLFQSFDVQSHAISLLSGQKANNSNWLLSSAPLNRSGVAKIADWIGIFSNTVTERTCSNV